MAKKRFTSGLDSLFGTPPEADKVAVPTKKKTARRTTKRAKSNTERGSSTKNFMADLESLFTSAINESVQEHKQKLEKGEKIGKHKRKTAVTGIDAVIRQTVQDTEVKVEKEKKRVTFVLDKNKLMKLKSIARLEKIYLKDIIDELVSEYIVTHDTN